MAIVTSLTADRMEAIEAASVVSGLVDGSGNLILSTQGGDTIDAGHVAGSDATVPDASTSVKGKIQIATSAEAALVSDATKAVTPAGLAWVQTQLTDLDTRINKLESRVGVELSRVAALSMTTAVGITFPWDHEIYDPLGFYGTTNGICTVPTGLDGLYSISATSRFFPGQSTGRCIFQLYKNSTVVGQIDEYMTTDYGIRNVSVTVPLVATDQVRVVAEQIIGSTVTLDTTSITYWQFKMYRVGP